MSIRFFTLVFLMTSAACPAEDLVEFLSGSKITGTVKQIRKQQKEFDFEATIGSRSTVRTYAFGKVHAVTMKGKRFVLTPRTDAATVVPGESASRSKSQIDQLIQTVGAQPPDWLESTGLDYPQSLDLSWPLKPPDKGWNNQKNMGQYIWDVINPNPSRWRSGIKLVYHCMSLHEGQAELLQRDMQTLGRMYFDLMQDYPRAAFWFQKARTSKTSRGGVALAECYWRLGNRQMAMAQLNTGRTLGGPGVVKLLGDMGSTDMAIRLADQLARTNVADQAFLAAGDALRKAGRFDQAISYYQKVLDSGAHRNEDYEKRFKARARESIEAIRLFDAADPASVTDGTHTSFSTGYNGRLDVAVQVANGRIEAVKVTNHQEKQFYSALTDTEASILRLQSVRGVDGTSGATITSQAIVNAAAKALAEAAK